MGKGKNKKNKGEIIRLELAPGVKNETLIDSGFRNSSNQYADVIKASTMRFERIKKLKTAEGLADVLKFSDSELSRIDEFVEDYCNSPETDVTSGLAKLLLIIGKTTFENSDEIIISNETYQKLSKAYIDNGNDEPFPYMIGGDVREKRVSEFTSLANNLNKGYTVYDRDEYPTGVSKDNNVSVEEFLRDAYNAAGYNHNKEIAIEISPKLDGISVNAGIVGGKFNIPLTRGDDEGSILLKGFENYQVSADKEVIDKERFGAQFEAFMTFKNRELLQENYGLEYTSNRGAANGVMMRSAKLDTFDESQMQYVSFYPIQVEGLEFKSPEEKRRFLSKMYVGPDDMIYTSEYKGNLKYLLQAVTEIFRKYQEIRNDLTYSIDGLVISILDEGIINALGRKGRKNKYQIALKFEPGKDIGIIKGIELSNGKKGFRSIMAVLDHSVAVNEKEFDRVLIGSVSKFEELDLHVGDKVEVVNVGDAMVSIAKVNKSEHSGEKIQLPTGCPECGDRLDVMNGKLVCVNSGCPAIAIGQMLNFVDSIGVSGYSDKTMQKLYAAGIRSIYDLVSGRDCLFDKAIKNGKRIKTDIIKALENCDDVMALTSLSIVGLGAETADKILSKVTLNELCADFDERVTGERIKTIPGIGNTIFAILEKISQNQVTLREIAKHVKHHAEHNTNSLRVVTTKVSSDVKNELKTLLKGNPDLKFVDSKSFDILVVDDYDVESGKMSAAIKRGLKPKKGIYTVKDFKEFLKNGKIKNDLSDNYIDNEEVVDESEGEKESIGTMKSSMSLKWYRDIV